MPHSVHTRTGGNSQVIVDNPPTPAAASGSTNNGSNHTNGDNSGYFTPSIGNAKKGKKDKKTNTMLDTWLTTWNHGSISGPEGLYAKYQVDAGAAQGGL